MMCRSVTENGDLPYYPRERDRDRDRDRDHLRIKSFHLRLYGGGARCLPEAPTLLYLPRISGGPLEVNGAKIKPEAPAFVALHRARTAEPAGGGEAVFASTDRVRAGEGVRFELYVGADRALKGIFRRRRGAGAGGWIVECQCAAEVDGARLGVSAAEICVVEETGVVMRERVVIERRRRRPKGFCLKLEEIPEEGEGEMDGCDCSGCDGDGNEEWGLDDESDGGDWLEGSVMVGEDLVEMERVRWAVDLGIWVMCFGVGFLVSRASYKGWRRKLF